MPYDKCSTSKFPNTGKIKKTTAMIPKRARKLRRRIRTGGCEYHLARAEEMFQRATFYKREGCFENSERMLAMGDMYIGRMCWYFGRVQRPRMAMPRW